MSVRMLSFTIFTSTSVGYCMSERQLTSVALYIPWSTAAVGLPVPTVNGAVSSDDFSTSNRRGGWQRLV